MTAPTMAWKVLLLGLLAQGQRKGLCVLGVEGE